MLMITDRLMALVLMTSVVLSCGRYSNDIHVRTIDCDEYAISPTASDHIADVAYIVLQGHIGQVDDLRISSDQIFVADYKNHIVSVYGFDGGLKGVINKVGRGPGEYIEIRAFAVDDRYVYILDSFTRRILFYDIKTLSFDHECSLPFHVWDFEILNDGGFVLACAPMQPGMTKESSLRYRVFITDSIMNVKKRMFEYEDSRSDAFAFRNYISSFDDKVIYSSFDMDGYHVLSKDNGEVLESVCIDFEHGLSDENRSVLSDVYGTGYSYQYDVPVMCDGYMMFKFVINNVGQEIMLSLNDCMFLSNSPDKVYKSIFGVKGSHEDLFISYWGDDQIYDMMISNGFTRASVADEARIKDGDTFLILYRMQLLTY